MISLPPDLPLGGYEMFLHLPDPAPSLYGIVPYSIRLANSNALSAAGNSLGDVWDPATGYHRLRHILNINNTATNAAPTGTEIRLLSYSVIAASNVNFVDPASPADRTTSTGQTATFSAPVTGTGPLRYQWLKDGASLPGATNATLVLSNVQPADAATYALQVSNPVSTNTSRTATLTVLPAAHRTISIDGNFNDWQNLAPIYSSGSNSPAATNPRDFYVCNDADFIYLMVTTWNPSVLVSSINNFYFNTDHNPATGYLSMGGSELLLQNGAGYQQKTGVFNFGTVTGLQHLCAPTGSASQFEFRLSRNALNTSDGTPVFKTNVISFVFEGENASFQTVNRVPANGAIQYTLVEPHPPGPLAIDSNGGGQLAVSWVGTGTLQTRSSLTGGVWTDLPAATSPCLIVATGAQQYFRLAR
jgi:hypothetical protein